MNITNVKTFFVNPGAPKNWLFIKIETEDAITGWGEAYIELDRDTSIAEHVEHMGRYLIGRSPFNIKHFTS